MTDKRGLTLDELIAGGTPEQDEAMRSTAPMTVVSAGAGTGKTHTLSRRFAWMLASDPSCHIDEMLTLTYTKTAAEEMRQDIVDRLRDWRERGEEALARRLDDAVARSEEAYISTIHAFSMRVLREAGLVLDIDPTSSLVSDPMEREFWRSFAASIESGGAVELARSIGTEAADRCADELELIGPEIIDETIEFYSADGAADAAKRASELFGSRNETPEHLLDFTVGSDDRLRAVLIDRYRPQLAEFADMWRDAVMPVIAEAKGKELDTVYGRRLSDLKTRWAEREIDDSSLASFVCDMRETALNGPSGKLQGRIKDYLGSCVTEWRDARKDVVELAEILARDELLGGAESTARRVMLLLACIGWSLWEKVKSEMGMLTFADMIRRAAEAVAADREYAERFRHVMIDEYQDTDGTQDDMVMSLMTAGEGGAKLFLVGDIKQSIYRFRRADPKLFAKRSEDAERGVGGAARIPLLANFRMNRGLIDGVNMVFSHIWRDGIITKCSPDDPQAEYEPMIAPSGSEERERLAPADPIEILIPPSDAEMKSGERRELLARALADRLVELVDSRALIPRRDGAPSPISWGDITVLVPSRTSYRPLEDAFDRAGIPSFMYSSKEYFNRGEVRDMVCALEAARDPSDSSALAGWIESAWSGAAPGTALSLLSEASSSETSLHDLFVRRCPDEAARFARFQGIARLEAPSSAILSLLDDMSWVRAYPQSSMDRVVLNIQRGAELLAEYEASLGRNLAAEAYYLADSMSSSGSGTEEPNESAVGDRVRVMTIHAAKGLGFPVVAVFGMERGTKPNKDKIAVSEELGLSMSSVPEYRGIDDTVLTGKKLLKRFSEVQERDESERLMYVAMTRARERLICIGDPQTRNKDPWIRLLLDANDATGSPFPVITVSPDAGHRTAGRSMGADDQDVPALLSEPRSIDRDGPKLARFSASAYAAIEWCPYAYRARYRQGIEMKWNLPDGDGIGGADLGSLAHWVLRRWDLSPDSLPDLLPDADAAARSAHRMPPYLRAVYADDRQREALRGWLAAFAKTPESRELSALIGDGALRRELSFSIPAAGTVLAGSMDLYWEDERGAHIRDWKITPEGIAARELYERQLELYALAASTGRGVAVADVGLIRLRPDDEQEQPHRPRKMDEIARSIEAAAKLAASGPFEPRRDRCRSCPFARGCIVR